MAVIKIVGIAPYIAHGLNPLAARRAFFCGRKNMKRKAKIKATDPAKQEAETRDWFARHVVVAGNVSDKFKKQMTEKLIEEVSKKKESK
jgi:hypothetical protein